MQLIQFANLVELNATLLNHSGLETDFEHSILQFLLLTAASILINYLYIYIHIYIYTASKPHLHFPLGNMAIPIYYLHW